MFCILTLLSFQCLTPDMALSVLDDDRKPYLTEEDYKKIATVLLYYIINLQDLCSPNTASSPSSSSSSSSGNNQFYLLALTNLHPAEDSHFLSLNETSSILHLINKHYNPSSHDASSDMQVRTTYLHDYTMKWSLPMFFLAQCVAAAHLLRDINVNESPGADVSSVSKVSASIINHILLGHCFRRRNLPSPAFFTDYIFQLLNCTSDLQIFGEFSNTSIGSVYCLSYRMYFLY